MSEIYLTVANGQSVSSMAVLPRTDRPFVVYASSVGAQALTVQFAPSSGGAFATLCRDDGSGFPWTVVSGSAGWSMPILPVTPFLRLATAAVVAATTSYMIVQVNR